MLAVDYSRHMQALDPWHVGKMLEEILIEWAQWVLGGVGPHVPRCISLESQWRSPQCWDQPEPRKPRPIEWRAYSVEVAVLRLPERERACLRAEYTVVRQPGETDGQYYERKRRIAKVPSWMFSNSVDKARKAIAEQLGID